MCMFLHALLLAVLVQYTYSWPFTTCDAPTNVNTASPPRMECLDSVGNRLPIQVNGQTCYQSDFSSTAAFCYFYTPSSLYYTSLVRVLPDADLSITIYVVRRSSETRSGTTITTINVSSKIGNCRRVQTTSLSCSQFTPTVAVPFQLTSTSTRFDVSCSNVMDCQNYQVFFWRDSSVVAELRNITTHAVQLVPPPPPPAAVPSSTISTQSCPSGT